MSVLGGVSSPLAEATPATTKTSIRPTNIQSSITERIRKDYWHRSQYV